MMVPKNARTGRGTAVYCLLILTIVYCFAFVDRQITTMLVTPIRHQFGVNDVQIGGLIGPAFIFSFMLVGLPAGLGVDRLNRRNLVIVAGILWSVGTGVAAFAKSFGLLVASRAIVGGAEAALFPAGMSLIAELFDRKRLPIAYSVFLASPYIGGGMALIVGGLVLGRMQAVPFVGIPLLGTIPGWQSTFLIVGLAGLLPILLLFTLREPRRPDGHATTGRFSVGEGLRFMGARWRFYLFFYLGMGLARLVNAMVAAWAPTYLQRTFDMKPASVGLTYGVYVLIAGLAGGVAGPLVNHLLSRRQPQSTMWTACLGPALIMLFVAMLTLVHSREATLLCLALFTLSYSFPLSVAGTSLQMMTPPGLRGVSAATYLIFNSLIGYALGPTLVPVTARYLLGGEAYLGEAMKLVGAICGMLSLLCLALSAMGYRRHTSD